MHEQVQPTRKVERRRPQSVLLHAIDGGRLRRAEDARLRRSQVREAIYRRALGISDVVATLVAVLLALVVASTSAPQWPALLLPVFVVVAAKASGLYDRDELLLHRTTADEIPRLFQLATLCALLFGIGGAIVVQDRPSQVVVLTVWVALFVLLVLGRYLARIVADRVAEPERVLVLGDRPTEQRLRDKLRGQANVEVVGFAPVEAYADDLPGLSELAADHGAQRLIVAPPLVGLHEETLNLIRGAKATGLRVSIVPGLLDVVGSAVVFDEIGGMTLLGVRRFGLTRSSRLMKRLLDVTGASVALLLFAPVMIVAALAVRLTSKGPVFYRQVRVGRDDEPFEILKFRTMVDGAHAMREELAAQNVAGGGLFKIPDDPRITSAGRWLRSTSLDELPQLLNVLRGDMSLVGPRPLVVDEDAHVRGFDRRRLMLTPGMTGPWQIAGSARIPLQEMVKIDYLYVAGWSVWADVKIMLRTVPYMLSRSGQ